MNTNLRKTIVRVSLTVLTTLAIVPMAWGQFTFTTNNGAITITGYNTAAALNAVIPASTNGYPVVRIGDYAFQYSSITNVTIPGSVTNIGNRAFFNCTSLTSVAIPNSVTAIGYDALFNCNSLTSVTIGNSVSSIGGFAFSQCYNLTSVTIPSSVASIGDLAFYSCASLTNIAVNVSNPNYSSFNGVLFDKAQTTLIMFPLGLGGSYTMPNSVTSIGFGAFYNCTSLTSVTIPNSVTNIGSYAFDFCTNLTAVYFQGNVPAPNNDSSVFSSDPVTVFYLPGTSGWGSGFDGKPTALWYLPTPLILTGANGNNNLGVRSNRFGFTISWATNASVVVEACTNLANPIWTPLATNALVSGTNYFSDSTPPTLPQRFYRVRAQ